MFASPRFLPRGTGSLARAGKWTWSRLTISRRLMVSAVRFIESGTVHAARNLHCIFLAGHGRLAARTETRMRLDQGSLRFRGESLTGGSAFAVRRAEGGVLIRLLPHR
jgi:hypothetical protein